MRSKLLWPPINLPLAWAHNESEWRGNLEWHLSALELSASIISTRPYISWLQRRLCWLEWRGAFLLPGIVATQTTSLLDAYSGEKLLALNEIRATLEQWTWTGPCLHTRLKKREQKSWEKGEGARGGKEISFTGVGWLRDGGWGWRSLSQWGCGLEPTLPLPWWEPSPPGLAAPELLLLCQISLGREHLAAFCTIADTDQPLLVRLSAEVKNPTCMETKPSWAEREPGLWAGLLCCSGWVPDKYMAWLFRDPSLAQGHCLWWVCWLICTQNFNATNSVLISQHYSWNVVRLLYFLIEVRGAASKSPSIWLVFYFILILSLSIVFYYNGFVFP